LARYRARFLDDLVAPGQAHQYTGVACLATIIGTFIERASTVAPPSSCLPRRRCRRPLHEA